MSSGSSHEFASVFVSSRFPRGTAYRPMNCMFALVDANGSQADERIQRRVGWMKSWKAFEPEHRQASRRAQRIPVTGLDRSGADVESQGIRSIKRNSGQQGRCPSYLRDWLRGITAAGERKNATGIVVWKAPRALDDDAVVILRLQDWQKLHGSGKKKKRPTTVKSSVSFKIRSRVLRRGSLNHGRITAP